MLQVSILLCTLFFLSLSADTRGQEVPRASNGVLNLSDWDFQEGGSLLLDGEWDFYWMSFRDSVDGETPVSKAVLPGTWTELEVTKGQAFGYGTYELKLILPKSRPSLAIEVPDMYSAYTFYINGRRWNSNGKIARTKEQYQPKFTPNTRSVTTSSDTLYLKICVANFDHSKGGIGQSIRLGTYALFKKRVLHVSFDIFLTGSLMMGGLFFLGLYLFGNQSKPILYFSLFCIVWGYRIIASGIYALHSLFDLPWLLALKLEYVSMFLAALLFTRYIYFLYPLDFNARLEKLFLFAFGALAFVALVFPPIIFTKTVEAFFVVVIPGFIIMVITHVRSWINRRNVSIYSMISVFVIFFVFLYFFLAYFGYLESSVYVTFIGSVVFIFLQSLVLSFRYSRELKDAKEVAEQASNAKMEFLSTMSHEIRTPLNAVIGLSNFLIEENPRDDQRESLDNLRFASENLLSLINDILDYNKIDAGKIDFEEKPFNIRRLVAGTI
ncbi:MAG: histidine kinase dimerization/phospho-acceptor domain-containing protein, partial [Bacteroidota bacterium]